MSSLKDAATLAEDRPRRWALITGASSGIGKALAGEFAAGGYDLVLVARDKARLEITAAELCRRFGIKALALDRDLCRPDSAREVLEFLSDEAIAVEALVNNAGFGVHGPFAQTPLPVEIDLVNLQIRAMLQLTKYVLPGMLRQGQGRILNVASVYSQSPVPYQAVYGACKAFLLSFSASLRAELTGRGISVTALCPGITRTEFRKKSGVGREKEGGMSAQRAAAAGYRAAMKGRFLAVPGLGNRLFVLAARHLPQGLVASGLKAVNRRRGVNAPRPRLGAA